MTGVSEAEWSSMSALRTPVVPRRGYGMTLGVSLLSAIRQPDILPAAGTGNPLNPLLESRFPSARITLSGRTSSGRSWHLAAMRLAPDNVTINGLFAGMALELRSGRLLLRPFAEVGGARVQSRFDTGGYSLSGAYVPVWDVEERDGLGFGGGATAEVTAFSNTILDVTGGAWSFGLPENAPDVPYLYLGLGLRLGR
jgi:hypothetical protein